MRDPGNGSGGKNYQSEPQQADRSFESPEIVPRSIPGSCVEQRRQKDQEYEIGLQGDLWHARDEADEQSAYDQENRVGYFQFATEHGKNTYDK